MVGVNWFWTVNGEQITDPGYANHVANKKSYYLGLAQNQLINMKRINSITQPGLRKFKFTQHYNNECAITTDVGPGYEKIFVDIIIDLQVKKEAKEIKKIPIELPGYIILARMDGIEVRPDVGPDDPRTDIDEKTVYETPGLHYYEYIEGIEPDKLTKVYIQDSIDWWIRKDPTGGGSHGLNWVEIPGKDDGNFAIYPLMHFSFLPTYVTAEYLGLPTDSMITGASEDGKYICGNTDDGAYIWTAETGYVIIGDFAAYNISPDGSTIVGANYDTAQAVRWTKEGGVQDIPMIGSADFAVALAASRDGSVIVGFFQHLEEIQNWGQVSTYHAFRWTEKEGMVDIQGLFLVPGWVGALRSQAQSVSDDGKVIVGQCNQNYQGDWMITNATWVWTEETGMLSLGQFTGDRYGVSMIANKKQFMEDSYKP